MNNQIAKPDRIFRRAAEWLDLSRNDADPALYKFAEAVQEAVTDARVTIRVSAPSVIRSIREGTLNPGAAMLLAVDQKFAGYLFTDFDTDSVTARENTAKRLKHFRAALATSPEGGSLYMEVANKAMSRYYRTFCFLLDD